MTPHQILGISPNATQEEAKAAYRKLAQQHHPDRGGDEEQFKKIKTAWEQIESGRTDKLDSFDSWANNASRTYENRRPDWPRQHEWGFGPRSGPAMPTMQINVPLLEAMQGFTRQLTFPNGEQLTVSLPAGIPPGLIFNTEGELSTGVKRQVFLVMNVLAGEFQFKHGVIVGGTASGDLVKVLPVDVLTLVTGGWVDVKDPTGDAFQVRIPEGFNPTTELKLRGKGYYNWAAGAPASRADLYLSVLPTVRRLSDIPATELAELVVKRESNAGV